MAGPKTVILSDFAALKMSFYRIPKPEKRRFIGIRDTKNIVLSDFVHESLLIYKNLVNFAAVKQKSP